MSRWISPRWWACFSASATARTISSATFSSKTLSLSSSSLIVVALDVLHDEVVVAVDLAGVDRVDDVVVRELGGDLGLALEPLDEFLVLGQGVEQDLDGDDPVDARLPGLVDDPHRALAELRDDLVAGDLELLGRLGPTSLSRRTDWLLVRTLASTMMSSRLLDGSSLLRGELGPVRPCRPRSPAAVARPRRRIDFSRFDSSRPESPRASLAGLGTLLSAGRGHEAVSLDRTLATRDGSA